MSEQKKCPDCGELEDAVDFAEYKGKLICNPCIETADLFEHDDPHGKNWSNDENPGE